LQIKRGLIKLNGTINPNFLPTITVELISDTLVNFGNNSFIIYGVTADAVLLHKDSSLWDVSQECRVDATPQTQITVHVYPNLHGRSDLVNVSKRVA
jgi:hypothetical protein